MWRLAFSKKKREEFRVLLPKEGSEPLILFFFISPFRRRHGIAILEVFFDITVTEVAISSFGEQLTSLFLFLLLFFVENFGSGVKITGQETSSYFFLLLLRSSAHGIIAIIPSIHNGPQGNRCLRDTIRTQFFPTICIYFLRARHCFSQARFLMLPSVSCSRQKKEIQNAFRHNIRLVWEIAVCVFSRKTRLVFLATGLGKVPTQVARYEILCEDDIVSSRKKNFSQISAVTKRTISRKKKKEQKR